MFVYLALVEAQAMGKAHWACDDFQKVFSSVQKQKKTLEAEYQVFNRSIALFTHILVIFVLAYR